MASAPIQEHFLHFIWRTKRFFPNRLKTTEGQHIQIVSIGQYNLNAGPDFLNARVYIGDTLWAGHIEIHVHSSDWYLHKHEQNPNYSNVVLHVVFKEDRTVHLADGSRLPCLELAHKIPNGSLKAYQMMAQNLNLIPCQTWLPHISEFRWKAWLDRLLVERLETKVEQLKQTLKHLRGDWEQLFFQKTAYGLGLPVNAEVMQELASSCPLQLIRHYRTAPSKVEALLFGQAGLLKGPFQDDYPNNLKQQFQYLQRKHQLSPIPSGLWKYSRLRPSSFPDLRIAQLAGLVQRRDWNFSTLLEITSIDLIYDWLSPQMAFYWESHFRLDTPSKSISKSLGEQQIQILLINVICPILFLYGSLFQKPSLQKRAVEWFNQLPAEKNRIIRIWKGEPFPPESAADSQAIIHLFKNYCKKKKCLECQIGQHIIGSPPDDFSTK